MNFLDKFIQKICDNECSNYFDDSKESCFLRIKKALPSSLLSKKKLNRIEEVELSAMISSILTDINQIDENRFWILYYRLTEQLSTLKCNTLNVYIQKINCLEYILDKAFQHIKHFDVNKESLPFQEVRVNLKNKNYKCEKNKSGVVDNYTKKIVKRYSEEALDVETANALMVNALLHIENLERRVTIQSQIGLYQGSDTKVVLKKEIEKRLKDDMDGIIIMEEYLLVELLHEEKFFNYMNNYIIKNRFIDFTRTTKVRDESFSNIKNHQQSKMEEVDEGELLGLNDLLDRKILEKLSLEEQLILRLKIGEKLDNSLFIKSVYLFDYREINILKLFTDAEHLEIKLYARNNIAIFAPCDRKITEVRKKLETDSYTNKGYNKELEFERNILLKLIFPDALQHKEIGLLLGYSEKQIGRKVGHIKNKVKKLKE